MASRKQPYSWGKVSPGDIISFRYKPKSGNPPKVQTILVLNPKLAVCVSIPSSYVGNGADPTIPSLP